MKKNFLLLLLCVALAACSVEPSAEKLASIPTAQPEPVIQTSKQDSVLYVNKVGYFPETNEFYVSLSPNEIIREEDYHFLSSQADSAVWEDIETSRFRLPMAIARDYFNFSYLDEIKLYNSRHEFITKGKLVRAEYLSNINGYFIAVFKPEGKVPDREADFYCLGTAPVETKSIAAQTIESAELTERIQRELAIASAYIWSVEHVLVQPYGSTFSLFAFTQKDGTTISYLTEFKDNRLKILYKLEEEYTLNSILPIPVESESKPVLLFHITLPESDAVDDYVVGIYDGKQYQLLADNRVQL